MHAITRRRFLEYGVATGAAILFPSMRTLASPASGTGVHLPKYVERLPVPGAGIVVATPTRPGHYAFTQTPIARRVHPALPPTPLWAYDDGSGLAGQAGSFGMALVAQSGSSLTVSYTNRLPRRYPSWLPVDARLTPRGDEIRVMTHLHGGFVGADSDGNPAVTPNGFASGETQTVYYPNEPRHAPASMLWFHDHGLGVTRLNVFAGLAAAYIVRDEFDTGDEPNPSGIPGGPYEIPLVIQDRTFAADGTFLYPRSAIADTTWIGEYFGDTMLVNGKVWPFVDVEPRLYRFRLLNGCNARILSLDLPGPRVWQIGAEGGMWDKPVAMRRIVLAPAERADLLVDFTGFAGETLVIKNHRPTRPVSTPAPVLEHVLQIRVGRTVSHRGPTDVPATLPGRRADLGAPVKTRYITLNEIDTDEPTWFLNLNGLHFDEGSPTETPAAGTIEDWVYVNMTADTHPMHLHLVTFQVIGRTPFDVQRYEEAYEGGHGVPGGIDPTPFATGPMLPPGPEERGYKDTVRADPGYFTTIRAKFDLPSHVTGPQTYVHHCHIVEHEDNDMMRPFVVTA